jgi:hypothetical protein
MEASRQSNPRTNEVTSTIQGLNWEACQQGAFYAGEVQGCDVVQVIGQALTRAVLGAKAVTPPRVEYAGQTYYRKAATPGQYQRP